jgi:serine/threonine protein kinase
MGAVYEARQPALDRRVALKVLPRFSPPQAGFEERFNREARALARLSHPNIVSVHEFGQTSGLHFFLMEFVDGTNLRQLQRSSRLSPREALQIIPQICDALQYAHDEGVVHRDIKPENVLLDRRGRVKIADFGLAMILDPDPEAHRLTAEGQVMGTPHYMAPEQIDRPLAVDHRADIYSLGVVFYEMLTGELPLGKFPPPSRKVAVDARLDEVVLRSLENDPSRRYQQVSQVATDVSRIAESPYRTTPQPNSTSTRRHWPRRLGYATVVIAGLVLALLLALPLTYFFSRTPTLHSAPPSAATLDRTSGTLRAALHPGATVELLAIGLPSLTNTPWWRPNGTPMANARFDFEGLFSPANPSSSRILIFQDRDLPSGTDAYDLEIEPSANTSGIASVRVDNQALPSARALQLTWPQAVPATANVRLGFALEPWQTIATQDPTDAKVTYTQTSGHPHWNLVFHRVSALGKDTEVTLVFDDPGHGWKLRVLAIDWEGIEHHYHEASGTPADLTSTWTYRFPDLPRSSIQEIQVQVRPVHWVEFRQLDLNAAALTSP